MNAWLDSLKLRILLPLVAVTMYAAVSFGALVAILLGAASHYHWRELVFGTVLMTLGTVTGIKTRQR